MEQKMLKNYLSAAIVVVIMAVAPAFAATPAEHANMCASALESEDLVPQGDYRLRFVKSRGASVKTITIKLIPDSGDAVTGVCKIRRGDVIKASLQA